MQAATSFDIKDMLVADSSLGLIYGTNLFIGMEPSNPKNCVTIFDTPGFPPDLSMDLSTYERPSIQIRVRNISYLTGMGLAQSILTALNGRSKEVWNESFYSGIFCANGPALLDWDTNSNARFIVNFDIQRRGIVNEQAPFSSAYVPYTFANVIAFDKNYDYGTKVVDANIVLSALLTAARTGNTPMVKLIGNGINTVNLSAFYSKTNDVFDSTLNMQNTIIFSYDGVDVIYSIIKQKLV